MGRDNRRQRKGISAVQTALILGLITLAVIIGVQSLGVATRSKPDQTAGDVADPSQLANRWSNCDTGEVPVPPTSAVSESASPDDYR